MASSTDFKIIHERYQTEGAPNGISIVQFCQMNGIVYSQYERWYKRTRRGKDDPCVVEVQVTEETPSANADAVTRSSVSLSFEIKLSNGLEIRHSHADFASLRAIVERLEALC